MSPLLAVEDLTVAFAAEDGRHAVVDRISFAVGKGRVVALVGESGCGKSVTARAIMRLLPAPAARIAGGRIRLAGTDLVTLDEPAMRAIRGDRIAMIFQEPMTSLNPAWSVGFQIDEALRLHTGLSAAARRTRTIELLGLVGIGAAGRRLAQYPHELSGGLRQRVMIAMALACSPELLIADEPTTALDVTVQAQILDLLARLRAELGMAILLITHDLGVVAEMADEVLVMYAGSLVERAPTRALFAHPRHPYTAGLMAAIPRLGERRRLQAIPGTVPPPGRRPPGCAFAERCAVALPRCATDRPVLSGEDHAVACWNPR
ncbi:MAG: ABC transporter ATP-binding protein [Geminicoccaceae bacterium]